MTTEHPHQAQRHDGHLRIGYAECIDLPEWGILALRAKIDTGARSSALHVDGIERLAGGKVRFDVVLNRKTGSTLHVVSKIKRIARVRSSSGEQEERIFVETRLEIGGVSKDIEVSLTSRHNMRFRMLLGRTALGHDFLIDAGRRYIQGRRPTKKIRGRALKAKRGRARQ